MRSLLPLVALLLACSSSSSTPGGGAATAESFDDLCTTNCTAQKKCNSAVDETTCVSRCKNTNASFVGKVRAEFVDLTAQCLGEASCDKLAGCTDQASASLAPSAAVQTFCDQLMTKNDECKATGEKARCLSATKIFADPTVEEARACLSKPCADYGACVLAAFGVSSS